MTPSRRVRVIAVILFLAALGGLAYLFWLNRPGLPQPGSPLYRAFVRKFQVGVAALDAGRDDLAKQELERAAELIPEEPAVWANLGLLHLRKNQLQQAADDLKRARDLAPASGAIEALLGELAEKQGRPADAVGHYRQAAATRPSDVALLYKLAQAVSKEGGKDSEADFQRLMEQILKIQPNNLRVLVLRAGAALRRKDRQAFRDSLERLAKLAPGWAPASRQALDELRKAANGAPGEAIALLQDLDRVLKAERSYARDSRAIMPQPGMVGTPLYTFVRLAPARATPAPPDRQLAFAPQPPAEAERSRGDVVRLVWMMDEKQRAVLVEKATDGGVTPSAGLALTPALFVADARSVRRLGAEAIEMPFPSGPRAIAPSDAGVLACDWDNDFRTDLVLAGAGGLRFWRQQPGGTFVDVTAKTGLPAEIVNGDYHGAWAADIEMDGDLDIIVARRTGAPLLLRNHRDGNYKALELFAGVQDVRAFVWADLDNDGAPDAVFLDAQGQLHVLANERAGQFAPWPLPVNLGEFLGLAAADVNADGVFDLLAVRRDGAIVRISAKDQRDGWQVAELAHWSAQAAAKVGEVAILIEDLDNNGGLDILVTRAHSTQVFLSDEQGDFAALASTIPLKVFAVLDGNGDGRLDLVGLSPGGRVTRAANQATKSYKWQTIRPLANPKAGDDRINSFALGGDMEIRTGLLVQKQAIATPVVHFGLGDADAADVVRIVWPNGVPQWEFDVHADRFLIAAQRLSGSCPFLFTWDGTQMRFAGDFMWGTPLGMYVNGQNLGDFPQTTEWLKIRGEHLVPRDGYFDVRVHANLWETDFFDQLALLVVDHPPGTEIHVDERFFLTPTVPKLYVTTPVRPVAQAWDHHGQDVTDLVRAIDGRYLDRAGRGRFQGVTQDHYVEIDLGGLGDPGDEYRDKKPLLLIARGWLHPTNSSINVALSQGKHDMPRPLSLEVPDGAGGWKTVLPALGCPAGKDKTMLIRLDNIPGAGAIRRLRLRTNMEIFWDFLGTARELEPSLARVLRPVPSVAELRFRGILEMRQKDRSCPEVPVYDKVIRIGQPWRDLTGYYTRFGDVRELLARVDDRYVIMNAGDEIAFRFPVPEGPPAGWKRDFIWESDGWTRDGDLNTRFGNTVLPLPAHGVKTDDRPPTRLEDDPVFRRFPGDWRSYHTRHVTGDDFARGLRQFVRQGMREKKLH